MEKKIKITELVAFILKHMTAEEALTKLMASQVQHYEKLKLEKQPADNPEAVSPYFIIIAAAMDLGWQFMIETGENRPIIRGLSVGSEDYLDDLFCNKELLQQAWTESATATATRENGYPAKSFDDFYNELIKKREQNREKNKEAKEQGDVAKGSEGDS